MNLKPYNYFLFSVKKQILYIKEETGTTNAQLSRALGKHDSFIHDILDRSDHSDMGLAMAWFLSESLGSPKIEIDSSGVWNSIPGALLKALEEV
jgi:hypothetical protein